jgi:hypothetical protein
MMDDNALYEFMDQNFEYVLKFGKHFKPINIIIFKMIKFYFLNQSTKLWLEPYIS